MTRMDYNRDGYVPGEGGGGRAPEGDYDFKVDDAVPKTFASGNRGAKITMLVGAFDNRDVKVFENLVYVDEARWKIDQFLTALGFDFMNPPELEDLIGRTGRGHFAPNDKGYLEATEFYEASAPAQRQAPQRRPAPQQQRRPAPTQQRPAGQGYGYGPPPMTDDDAPPF